MLKKLFTLLIIPITIILASQIFLTQASASDTSNTANEINAFPTQASAPDTSNTINEINAGRDYFGPFRFKTNDGRWDGQFFIPSTGDVIVRLSGDVFWEWGLSVRLCSKGSGRCTGFGPLKRVDSVLTRTFTNVLPGSYYLDVRHGGTVSGYSRIEVRY